VSTPKNHQPAEAKPTAGTEASPANAAGQRDAELAQMRHTLRTPLNHIIGYSEMLMEEADERALDSFTADLKRIHTAGKQLQALITEFLDPVTLGKLDGPSTAAPMSPVEIIEAENFAADTEPQAIADALSGHLLVVDDNEGNRDMLARRLRHQGYRVSVAENGRQGLDFLTAQSVDLILLDVLMPEMDGYDVLKELKSAKPWRDIPVIMVSALGEIESVVRCIEQGAEDYLTKPFDPVLLRARIGACLEKKRLRDQEVLYLKDVAHVTDAAAAVESGTFAAQTLADVAARADELGRLARIFERMALEVQAREQRLKQQIQELRIEVDEAKKAQQVAEITETDYFHDLREKARTLRNKVRGS
jgi:DNA-binding response OmpR family regulator